MTRLAPLVVVAVAVFIGGCGSSGASHDYESSYPISFRRDFVRLCAQREHEMGVPDFVRICGCTLSQIEQRQPYHALLDAAENGDTDRLLADTVSRCRAER
jgi:hypothetical protein